MVVWSFVVIRGVQPVNTGFSYSSGGDIGVVTEKQMAQDMWEVLALQSSLLFVVCRAVCFAVCCVCCFAVCSTSSQHRKTHDADATHYQLFQKFFAKYPKYSKLPFHVPFSASLLKMLVNVIIDWLCSALLQITGESYAGHCKSLLFVV